MGLSVYLLPLQTVPQTVLKSKWQLADLPWLRWVAIYIVNSNKCFIPGTGLRPLCAALHLIPTQYPLEVGSTIIANLTMRKPRLREVKWLPASTKVVTKSEWRLRLRLMCLQSSSFWCCANCLYRAACSKTLLGNRLCSLRGEGQEETDCKTQCSDNWHARNIQLLTQYYKLVFLRLRNFFQQRKKQAQARSFLSLSHTLFKETSYSKLRQI